MPNPRAYKTFADFEREQIRPSMRIGWSMDELEEGDHDLDFDLDPFEAALDAAESEDLQDLEENEEDDS